MATSSVTEELSLQANVNTSATSFGALRSRNEAADKLYLQQVRDRIISILYRKGNVCVGNLANYIRGLRTEDIEPVLRQLIDENLVAVVPPDPRYVTVGADTAQHFCLTRYRLNI